MVLGWGRTTPETINLAYIYAKWMVFACLGPKSGARACKNHPFGVYIYAKLMVSGVHPSHPKNINLAYIYIYTPN